MSKYNPETEFDRIVANRIASIYEPLDRENVLWANLDDPEYAADVVAQKMISGWNDMPYDYGHGLNGSVTFGKKFDTRHLLSGDKEIILANNFVTGKSEVHVNTFKEFGEVASRTIFKKSYNSDDLLKHHEESPFIEISKNQGDMFSRVLKQKEIAALYKVINDPQANSVVLSGLVRVSRPEKRLMDKSRRLREHVPEDMPKRQIQHRSIRGH